MCVQFNVTLMKLFLCFYVYSHLAVVSQPQPLALLEEDIREVLKLETGTDIFHKTDYQSDHRAWKHNVNLAPTLLSFCCRYLKLYDTNFESNLQHLDGRSS